MSLNLPLSDLPDACDVLVIGAGPAGSACARTLARAGLDVVQVDQHAFPRDRDRGDALIPDAHRALRELGLLDAVMARAHPVGFVGCIAPHGGRVDVPGTLAVLPRKALDLLLAQGAVDAGVRFHAPARFVATVEEDGVLTGARLQQGPQERSVRARQVVLATGAVPQALSAAGMCERQSPSGVALRGYVRHRGLQDRTGAIEIVWHRALRPGYGWIFPCGDDVFNIGVGVSHSHDLRSEETGRHVKSDINLRQMMEDFQQVYEPARRLMSGGELLGPLKGAPLRCTLEGARFSRPGLLVTGEAAGSTYSFTGEGIGKALETGILAAQAILQTPGQNGLKGADADADARTRGIYEAGLAALKPRFSLYERANQVNRFPWLADLLIWRGRRSAGVLRAMSGVLEETSNPGNLLSVSGMLKLMRR